MQNPLPGIPLVESPLFHSIIDQLSLTPNEQRIAVDLHEEGFAVLDFPDPEIDARIERIKANLRPRFGVDFESPISAKNTGENQRIQDAWLVDDDVREIATNANILALLKKLYGRQPFPFQTLNFPVGTQQHIHSDSNHFSSLPERFMCGVWLAFEDVHPDAGPLTYIPGSHRWPVLTNLMIGRKAEGAQPDSAQAPFEGAWDAMVEASNRSPATFLARKGQALIWAANLLHGGSPQRDVTLTRWSQVSHYYFEDCIYYTPGFSDEAVGRFDLRTVSNIATGEVKAHKFLGEPIRKDEGFPVEPRRPWLARRRNSIDQTNLPQDFNGDTYLSLNPDVAAAEIDPAEHYLRHGLREGRRYRRG